MYCEHLFVCIWPFKNTYMSFLHCTLKMKSCGYFFFPKWKKKKEEKKELGTRQGPVFFWKNMYIQLYTHEKLHLLLKQKTINLSVQRMYNIILVPAVAGDESYQFLPLRSFRNIISQEVLFGNEGKYFEEGRTSFGKILYISWFFFWSHSRKSASKYFKDILVKVMA